MAANTHTNCFDRDLLTDSLVVRLPTVFLAGQKATPLHQPQVLRSHVAGNFARFGQFANRKPPLEEHLHHPKPMRMG
jgi:hypothetical protein